VCFTKYYKGDKVKEDKMGGACITQEGKEKHVQYFGGKKKKRRKHLEDLGVDGRIIADLILGKFISLRIETSSGLL
jgi:hypothetical protein